MLIDREQTYTMAIAYFADLRNQTTQERAMVEKDLIERESYVLPGQRRLGFAEGNVRESNQD